MKVWEACSRRGLRFAFILVNFLWVLPFVFRLKIAPHKLSFSLLVALDVFGVILNVIDRFIVNKNVKDSRKEKKTPPFCGFAS